MKLLVRLAFFASLTLSQLAWADAGPYYVSFPGFCNQLTIYVNAKSDVYGTETGCSANLGTVVTGSINADGSVTAAQALPTKLCLMTFSTTGINRLGCTIGGAIGYAADSPYTVRMQAGAKPGATPAPTSFNFVVSTEKPDAEAAKSMPSIFGE